MHLHLLVNPVPEAMTGPTKSVTTPIETWYEESPLKGLIIWRFLPTENPNTEARNPKQ
jgi:hypothetical protein